MISGMTCWISGACAGTTTSWRMPSTFSPGGKRIDSGQLTRAWCGPTISGQRVTTEPKALLSKAGFTVVDVPEGHICCGSAGTYNIMQPELAGQLRERKVENIQRAKPDLVAAGNIGCITHLAGGMDLPIVHTVELLDWAYGGPVPPGLERLKSFMNDVPMPPQQLTPDDYLRPA